MIRKLVQYSIQSVLADLVIEEKAPKRVSFYGDEIKPNSERYILFKEKGTGCVKCGVEGKYFYKERAWQEEYYHLNLYAVNSKNEEILMTKDHVIPQSLGGKNQQSNYVPMCSICNHAKGATNE